MCGQIVVKHTQSLAKNTGTHCGCSRPRENGPTKSMLGKKIGALTVIEQAPTLNGSRRTARWLCLCSCGNKVIRNGVNLRKPSDLTSCGCLYKPPIVAGPHNWRAVWVKGETLAEKTAWLRDLLERHNGSAWHAAKEIGVGHGSVRHAVRAYLTERAAVDQPRVEPHRARDER